jgi:hypothetical protein
MQVWLHPARIRTHVVYISLEYDCARPKSNQFTLKAITAGPTSDQTLSELNQPWFERSRRDTEELVAAGGLGVLRYMLHCSGTGEQPLTCGVSETHFGQDSAKRVY